MTRDDKRYVLTITAADLETLADVEAGLRKFWEHDPRMLYLQQVSLQPGDLMVKASDVEAAVARTYPGTQLIIS